MTMPEVDREGIVCQVAMILPSREILVEDGAETPSLPRIVIPPWTRLGESVTAAIADRWHLASLLLSCARDDFSSGLLAIVEVRSPVTNSELTPVPGSTIVEQLPPGLKNPLDRILHNRVPGSEPFSRLGWLDEALTWIQASVPTSKIPFSGKTSQLNASGQFQLIRFDTERPPAYWLKATGHPNTHEYAITTFLASRTPEYLPRIVAARPNWNAWVMEEHGQSLYHSLSLATAKTALVRLAELQQRWVGQEATLLAHGCHDHRLHALLTQIDAIIDYLDEAMRRQTSTKVAPMSRDRLVALGEILKDTCAATLELPIPDTLLHNDISPGSILFDGSTCVFSDWAEAYLGNPFLTLQQFCSHLERCRSEAVEWIPELRSLYGQCWLDRLGAFTVERALVLSPLLAVLSYFYAHGSWLEHPDFEDAHLAGYHRSMARIMERLANETTLMEALC
jgi:hypothetical protein